MLVGIATAALLRAMVGARDVRRLFGEDGRGGLVRPIVIAFILPVDSLGVLPVLRELRRAGVPTPKLVAFALAAPLVGPLTLVYALTALGISTVLLLFAIAVMVSLLGGTIASRWADRSPAPEIEPPAPAASSGRRLANTVVAAGRICVPGVIVDLLICLGVAGLAATGVDAHGLIDVLSSHSMLAVPIMALIGLPAYVSPTTGVMQASGMAAMEIPLGAAVGLWVFGVGQNAALCVWLSRLLGFRRLALIGLVLLAASWPLGLAADAAFGPAPVHEHDEHAHDHEEGHAGGCCGHGEHNHALDGLGQYQYGRLRNPLYRAFRFSSVPGFAALGMLGALCLAGALFHLLGIDVREESADGGVASGAGLWNRPIPGRWLGLLAVALLASIPVVGVYVYYPPLDELFTQMTFVRANAVLAVKNGPRETAVRELQAWSKLAAKVRVSALIRGRVTGEEARNSTVELRRNLDLLRELVRKDRKEDMQPLLRAVMDSYDDCRWAHVHR